MRLPLYFSLSFRGNGALVARDSGSITYSYGRTAAYRRISRKTFDLPTPTSLLPKQQIWPLKVQANACAQRYRRTSPFLSKDFTTYPSRFQSPRQGEDIRDPPRPEQAARKNGEERDANFAEGGPRDNESTGKSSEGFSGEKSEESSEKTKNGKDDKDGGRDKKKDEPPPPPHGDKSPWQVFKETLYSEFQASKEWNESTKALASSAHQFTENESIKRARAAYSAASGAATSTTSSALRETGKALGQGAAWTWDTPIVKGVRSGVKATGRGIEKATRPVRETKVYKTTVGGVKDVIDDGSSSRYGGWVEKEERRKQRELRELNEAAEGGKPGNRAGKMEEDPKFANGAPSLQRLYSNANGMTVPEPKSRFTKTPHGKNHGGTLKTPTA